MAKYMSGHANMSLWVQVGEQQVRNITGMVFTVPVSKNIKFGISGGFAPHLYETNDPVLIKALDESPFNARSGRAQGLFWRVDDNAQIVTPVSMNPDHVKQDMVLTVAKLRGVKQQTLDIKELENTLAKEIQKKKQPERTGRKRGRPKKTAEVSTDGANQTTTTA